MAWEQQTSELKSARPLFVDPQILLLSLSFLCQPHGSGPGPTHSIDATLWRFLWYVWIFVHYFWSPENVVWNLALELYLHWFSAAFQISILGLACTQWIGSRNDRGLAPLPNRHHRFMFLGYLLSLLILKMHMPGLLWQTQRPTNQQHQNTSA